MKLQPVVIFNLIQLKVAFVLTSKKLFLIKGLGVLQLGGGIFDACIAIWYLNLETNVQNDNCYRLGLQ